MLANKYTGSNTGKSGLNVKKTSGTPDVNGVTEIQLDSNLTLTNNGGGSVTIQSSGGGGGGTPGGSDTQVQYNNAGSFGGISGATTNGTAVTVSSNNLITTSPKVVTGLADEDGNSTIKTPPCGGTGANEITVSNQQAGSSPTIAATGSDTNLDLGLIPKGTGKIVVGTGSASGTITSSGTQDLVLDTNSGTNSGSITITDGANGNITLSPDGTGEIIVGNGTSSGNITSSGAYDLVLDTNTGNNSSEIRITDGLNGAISLSTSGTGNVDIASADPGGGSVSATGPASKIAGIQTNIITAVSPGGVDLLEVAQMGQCLYLDVDTYTIGQGGIDATNPLERGYTTTYIPTLATSVTIGGSVDSLIVGGTTSAVGFTVPANEPFTVVVTGALNPPALGQVVVFGNATAL